MKWPYMRVVILDGDNVVVLYYRSDRGYLANLVVREVCVVHLLIGQHKPL
jgi:hypothetical protein